MKRLIGICRNNNCANHGQEFTRLAKTSTYKSTDGTVKPRTDVSCPSCLTWSKIHRVEEAD